MKSVIYQIINLVSITVSVHVSVLLRSKVESHIISTTTGTEISSVNES